MSIDVTKLYDFRVAEGKNEPIPVPNRRRAAKRLVSLIHKGANVKQLRAERRVNGEWQDDPDTYTMLRNMLEKEAAASGAANGSEPAPAKPLTTKKSLQKLGAIARLAASADTISEDHIQAVQDAFDAFTATLSDEEVELDEEDVDGEQEPEQVYQ